MKEKIKNIVAGTLGFIGALSWILYMDSLNEPDGITPKQILMLILLFLLVIAALVLFILDYSRKRDSFSHSVNDLNIISEMVKNGYSDKMIEMTKEAAKKSICNPNLYLSYRDEVIFLASAYYFRHEYYEAISWMETLDIEKLKKLNNKEQASGYGVVSYYDMWMMLCRATRDYNKAEEIIEKANKDIPEYTVQNKEVAILIEEIYYEYFFLVGKLDTAKKHALNIDQLYQDYNRNSIAPDITMAEIFKAMGDIDEYKNRVHIAEEKLKKSKNAIYKTMYNDLIEKNKE